MQDLKNAGIISFKVEGRNKTVNYLASVWLAYREACDALERWESFDSHKLAEELFGISNRWYIPGFLAGNLNDNSQFYERNGWFKTKVFCGILRDFDVENKLCRVEVKNPFFVWDEIEIVNPDWVKKAKVEKIYRTKINHWTEKRWTTFTESIVFDRDSAEKVQSAHWGWYEVWINMDQDYTNFGIIRKQATEADQNN
jgi:putative protease